ncbi:DUF6255 family natural product biosynthesis protein [Streptomyces olivoverticillatus]|uniref:DUF6255 family natural product biosynthesis protein n=1 Tax=Streptomyces olivoverticillatus TaxID=66427 RepID=UPI003CCE1269
MGSAARCAHRSGWTHATGESHCNCCGTRRFTQYGALRPPGLPQAVATADRDPRAADRSAALNVALASRRGARRSAWRSPS